MLVDYRHLRSYHANTRKSFYRKSFQRKSTPYLDDLPPVVADNFENGAIIGNHYRVLAFIGEGGMGLVYKVEHLMMNKILALKVLKTEHLSEIAWRRFRNEAQVIARLDHINVVKIYDMNQTADGRPYYTMDLLVGHSLADYLVDNKRLTLRNALPVFRQVCAGLGYAHERGIIHRDIKPGNIMLINSQSEDFADSTVKIVDFGIAKLVDEHGHSVQGLTKPGEIFGSPLYMSPEQCGGASLDARADMYSVGVTLFQSLTGRPPLVGRTAIETTIMHQSTLAPPLHTVAPDIDFPAQLEKLVARLLAKKAEDRFRSLTAVAEALTQIEKELPTKMDANAAILNDLITTTTSTSSTSYSSSTTTSGLTSADTRLKLILFAGVLFLVASVGGTMMLTWANHRKSELSTIPLTNAKASSYFYDEVNSQTISAVMEHLRSRQRLYSVLDGTKILEFNFPVTFSLGQVKVRENGAWLEARGHLSNPLGGPVSFEVGDLVKAYPQLLNGFRRQDFAAIYVKGLSARNEELIAKIAEFDSVKTLDLPDSFLVDSDLKYFNKLKNLYDLNLDNCNIKGATLAQSPLMDHINVLHMRNIDNITPVITSLSRKKIMVSLIIGQSNVTNADMVKIGRLSQLLTLYILRTNISDQDLKELLPLTHLRYLNISGCNNLTRESLKTLQKMKSLDSLILPDHLDTDKFRKLLQGHLPKLVHFRQRGG